MKELPTFDLNAFIPTRLSRRTALVAQLDRASDYESEGSVFESRRVHHPEFQNHRGKEGDQRFSAVRPAKVLIAF